VAQALQLVNQVQPIGPVILDLHNLTSVTLVTGVAGVREDVAWQVNEMQYLGFKPLAHLDYARFADRPGVSTHSVLPSRLDELIDSLGGVPFLARAGNGIVYAQGGPTPSKPSVPIDLQRRVKEVFDPKGILPAMSW
jgi:hypothetical protein